MDNSIEFLLERYNLAFERIEEINKESCNDSPYCDYFEKVSEFLLLLKEPEFTKEYNNRLYGDITGNNYSNSFANPDYISKKMSVKMGQNLALLYSDLRGLIPYVFSYKHTGDLESLEIIIIYLELFIEVFVSLTGEEPANEKEIAEVIYWFNSDNSDIIIPNRIKQQLVPEANFSYDIIMNEDLNNTSYLYKFGDYISDNEIKTAEFLAGLPEDDIVKMASTYSEGYRIGFIKTGKDLSKKGTVNIRYSLGFERIIREAVRLFKEMGLEAVIYPAATLTLIKNGLHKIGYYGGNPNRQYDYDHKDNASNLMTKDFVNRKIMVSREAYEKYKKEASLHAGPAVMEVFGEKAFEPVNKENAIIQHIEERKLQLELTDRMSQLVNEYIKGEERSYTIIAFPIPEIGEQFEDIFRETVKLNTLDYRCYEKMQQKIIDVLDKASSVHVIGSGKNKTDLTISLHNIDNPEKETKFENCVADVNIPVGEVFTSPRLKGTNGLLNVTGVFLEGLYYKNLSVYFKDGMTDKITCDTFENEEENKKYIDDNLLFHHNSLPMGEFAIGTNTVAYKMARDFKIEDKLPILIGEKTGPHFAIGDTCYSHAEDIKVYNEDGKEIIPRDNEITEKYRKTDTGRAYFNCHTDITIPYDELDAIYAVSEDAEKTAIIKNGIFVLEGLEELNKPLK